MKILAIAAAVCCMVATQAEQPVQKLDGTTVTSATIDSVADLVMKGAKVEGLNIAVLNNNRPVFVKSYGQRNKPAGKPMTNNTIVYAASFSKAVFGYLVMKLVDEKIIDLDKPLYTYLKKDIGDYEYFADLKTDARWKLITARMCLSHTTGLPNVRWFNPSLQNPPIDTIGTLKLWFTPGTRYAYSGEGFKLLQLVVEEITQQSTDALAVERIFKPLQMTRTGFIWHADFGDDDVAVGHLNTGEIDSKKKRTVAVAGGSLVTTINDYAKFVAAVMQQKGLSIKSAKEMISPQIRIHSATQFPPVSTDSTAENADIRLGYGLGWGVMDCPGIGRAFFKEGNGDSWRNYNINFKDKGISLIIMTNSENGEEIFQYLAEALVGKTCIPWKWQGYMPYDRK